MSKVCVTMISGFILSLACVALADDGPTPNTGRPVTFEEFRARCANPVQFPEQIPPMNITISCQDANTTWLAAAPGEVPLNGNRQITLALQSTKFRVPGEAHDFPTYIKGAACARFKEVIQAFSVERTLSCEDILGRKGGAPLDPLSYCAALIDSQKIKNPKGVVTTETGRLIDTCGNK